MTLAKISEVQYSRMCVRYSIESYKVCSQKKVFNVFDYNLRQTAELEYTEITKEEVKQVLLDADEKP